jgi:hypothetical protein
MRPCTHTCMRACACMAAVTNSAVGNTKTKDRAAGAGHEDGGVALALPHAGGRDSEAPRQDEGPCVQDFDVQVLSRCKPQVFTKMQVRGAHHAATYVHV